jgi:hypothetical protein
MIYQLEGRAQISIPRAYRAARGWLGAIVGNFPKILASVARLFGTPGAKTCDSMAKYYRNSPQNLISR